MSYCDHSLSVGVRPSIRNFLVNTLASTNINQSSPNLVEMYMTIRSRRSLVRELIGTDLSELSALELKKFAVFDFVYTLASANQYQTWPQYICLLNLGCVQLWVKLNQNICSYLPLNLEKIAEYGFVYTPSSTNIYQSALNLVKCM